jgi:hypothetical protein
MLRPTFMVYAEHAMGLRVKAAAVAQQSIMMAT